jgi:hypothetical protein
MEKSEIQGEQYAPNWSKKKLITLYDKAELYYQDIEWNNRYGLWKKKCMLEELKDSTGKYTQYPNFKQGLM